jgi:hypothetical protein
MERERDRREDGRGVALVIVEVEVVRIGRGEDAATLGRLL